MPDRIVIQKNDYKKRRYFIVLSSICVLFVLFLVAVQFKMTFTKGVFAGVEQSFNEGYDQIQAGLDYAEKIPVDLTDPSEVINSMSQELSTAISIDRAEQEVLDLIAKEMIDKMEQ